MIETNAKNIAAVIYRQIELHIERKNEFFEDSGLRAPHSTNKQQNFSRFVADTSVTLDSQVDTFHASKIYTGFTKACHSSYIFDSAPEARFAYLLEKESSVEDWLRPAKWEFEGLYWRDASGNANHLYEPDFVVELCNEVVLVEIKRDDELEAFEVRAKAESAKKYCQIVSENIGNFGITKPWRYVMIPASRVTMTSSVGWLLK
jgi:type III restriction enzyme